MGDLFSLEDARQARAARWRAVAGLAAMHPALRWVAGGDPYAHRRTLKAGTVCGLPGPLAAADTSRRLCPACYPPRAGR